jgi:hypothetical protein
MHSTQLLQRIYYRSVQRLSQCVCGGVLREIWRRPKIQPRRHNCHVRDLPAERGVVTAVRCGHDQTDTPPLKNLKTKHPPKPRFDHGNIAQKHNQMVALHNNSHQELSFAVNLPFLVYQAVVGLSRNGTAVKISQPAQCSLIRRINKIVQCSSIRAIWLSFQLDLECL